MASDLVLSVVLPPDQFDELARRVVDLLHERSAEYSAGYLAGWLGRPAMYGGVMKYYEEGHRAVGATVPNWRPRTTPRMRRSPPARSLPAQKATGAPETGLLYV